MCGLMHLKMVSKMLMNTSHGQVQLIPFYGDIQLSLYMGIFLKIDRLQPMEKVQILPFLCKRVKPQRVT